MGMDAETQERLDRLEAAVQELRDLMVPRESGPAFVMVDDADICAEPCPDPERCLAQGCTRMTGIDPDLGADLSIDS